MSDVCYLFVQKYDDSAFFLALEQLGSRGSAYSVPLDDHPESFKRRPASSLQPGQAVVVLFSFSYDIP